jgi:hypothetical protein
MIFHSPALPLFFWMFVMSAILAALVFTGFALWIAELDRRSGTQRTLRPRLWRRTLTLPVNYLLTAGAVLTLILAILLVQSIPTGLIAGVTPLTVRVLAIVLATFGGGPVALAAVELARRRDGAENTPGAVPPTAAPVPLRGGTALGLLERLAVVGTILAGFPEGIAIVVAIKGLGRFTELTTGETKERFMIGTLASLIWACACTLLVR